MSHIKRIFTPPVFEGDEDKTIVAQSLHILLLVGLFVAPMAMIVFAIVAPSSLPRVGAVVIPIFLVLFTSWALVQRGRVRLGASLVVWVAWVATTLSAWMAGGLKGALFGVGSVVVVVLAGFLLGKRNAFDFVFLNVLATLVMAWSETQGWVPPAPSSVSEISVLISYGFNLLVVAAALYVALNALQAALHSSRRELAERRRVETEREALIQELESKNAELERFTYTVSHDLKSPLITIRGFLGFLEKDARDRNVERLNADISRIIEATEKMQRLLNDLLELSRIGRLKNRMEDVSFDLIAHDAVDLVRGRLMEKNVQISVAEHMPIVHGDRVRLVEVAQNLIDNAAKFMGDQPHPHIEIGMRGADADGNPIFFVRDNGIGIDPKYHTKVFGLFDKLDPQVEGTGVGLAVVKRVIEVHGGRIWIESEGIGKGATFCFTLPRQVTN